MPPRNTGKSTTASHVLLFTVRKKKEAHPDISVGRACNTCTWKAVAGGPGAQGRPRLHNEPEAMLEGSRSEKGRKTEKKKGREGGKESKETERLQKFKTQNKMNSLCG